MPEVATAAYLLAKWPYLATARHVFGFDICNYPNLAPPLDRSNPNDIRAARFALWLAAAAQRRLRGYILTDAAGQFIQLDEDPEHGWLVEEIGNPDGSQTRVYCADFALGPSPEQRHDSRQLLNNEVRTIVEDPTAKGLHDLPAARYSAHWQNRWNAVFSSYGSPDHKPVYSRQLQGDWLEKSMGGYVPIFRVALHMVNIATAKRTRPTAPPSTEKGAAEWAWPEEWEESAAVAPCPVRKEN